MKNRLAAIVILIFVSYAFTGCENSYVSVDVSAETVWAAIEEVVPEETLPVMMEIDASELKTYYGLGNNEIMDFAGQMPLMNVAATEILIVRVQKNQAEAVFQAVEERQAGLEEKWSGSDETQYEFVQNCRIVQNSDWLLFVVAEAAEEIVSAFNTCIDSYKS